MVHSQKINRRKGSIVKCYCLLGILPVVRYQPMFVEFFFVTQISTLGCPVIQIDDSFMLAWLLLPDVCH